MSMFMNLSMWTRILKSIQTFLDYKTILWYSLYWYFLTHITLSKDTVVDFFALLRVSTISSLTWLDLVGKQKSTSETRVNKFDRQQEGKKFKRGETVVNAQWLMVKKDKHKRTTWFYFIVSLYLFLFLFLFLAFSVPWWPCVAAECKMVAFNWKKSTTKRQTCSKYGNNMNIYDKKKNPII